MIGVEKGRHGPPSDVQWGSKVTAIEEVDVNISRAISNTRLVVVTLLRYLLTPCSLQGAQTRVV